MERRQFLALALWPGPQPGQIRLSAHRGALRHAPENTLEAYEKAAQLGAAYVELDVRTTKDGALVLMHDSTVDRTTNGHGPVAGLTLKEIRRLHPPVPTFREALLWARRRGMRIDVDHKAATVEAIAHEIRRTRMTSQVVIEGPRDRLLRFVELLPGVDTMPKVNSLEDIAEAGRTLHTRTIRLSLPQLADPRYVHAVTAIGAQVSVTILGPNDTLATRRTVIAQGAQMIETDNLTPD